MSFWMWFLLAVGVAAGLFILGVLLVTAYDNYLETKHFEKWYEKHYKK